MKHLPKSKHHPKTGVYKSFFCIEIEVAVITKNDNCSIFFIYLN